MDRHTTFRTGGPARYFLVIETRKELAQVLAWLQEEALPWFLLGNGSNLLVGDRGYRGAILHLAGEFLKTEIDEATIRCGAGAMLSAVSRSAMEAGLTGLEFASGIPGTIGGAVRMNAGAYNGEIAGVGRGDGAGWQMSCIQQGRNGVRLSHEHCKNKALCGAQHCFKAAKRRPKRNFCYDAGAFCKASGKTAAGISECGQYV